MIDNVINGVVKKSLQWLIEKLHTNLVSLKGKIKNIDKGAQEA